MNISVVIPCKGFLGYFRRVAHLWERQTVPPAEVIVVDYGCPDGVGDWVAERFPGWRVVRVGGDTTCYRHAHARNCGAVVATGGAILVADCDMLIPPDTIARMVAALERGGDLAVIAFTAEDGSPLPVGTCLVRRELYHQVRGYDEAYVEYGYDDSDFYARCEAAGAKVVYLQNITGLPNGADKMRHYRIQDVAAALEHTRRQFERRGECEVNSEGYGR